VFAGLDIGYALPALEECALRHTVAACHQGGMQIISLLFQQFQQMNDQDVITQDVIARNASESQINMHQQRFVVIGGRGHNYTRLWEACNSCSGMHQSRSWTPELSKDETD
jgi:hypothetical protein